MRAVQTGPIIGLIGEVVLLVVLAATVGLSIPAWVVGVTCGVVTFSALTRSLARSHASGLGPADRVTLTRATLVGGVAALTADSLTGSVSVPLLVGLTIVALVLDAVDGWVARRSGTVSPLGARFDMETDAFLIFVLSVYVAQTVGAWVLAIGLARYVFVAAGWVFPWLCRPVPPRYWRKVVAAVQGIVLTFAAADVLPAALVDVALAAALALLAESFGRDVWWLWRARQVAPVPARNLSGLRTGTAGMATGLACVLVWFALLAPDEVGELTPRAFARVPLEGLLIVGLVIILPAVAGRLLAVLVGLLLGVLTLVKVLDMGFIVALGRPFKPVSDWVYFGSAEGLLTDSIGRTDAIISVAVAGVLAVAVLVGLPLCVLRLTRVVERHRSTSLRVVAAFTVVWVGCAVIGVQAVTGAPVASTSAAGLAYGQVIQARADIQDEHAFARTASVDAFRSTPGSDLLTGLRGKDVLFVVVESYGQVAVQGSAFSPQVDSVLDSATSRLHAAGFSAQSAFLNSPTFGGISWLAHSTLQSGLWIDTQQRYNALVASDRLTLSDAFKRAGWRTVGDVPSNYHYWPEGTSFYHYDKIYDARNVGYAGPRFSYAAMPDQYILSAFQHNELDKPDHPPVMAEIDLVSSHTPWTPLPHLVPPGQLGDGSVFNSMVADAPSKSALWRDPDKVRAAYGQSIQYSLNAITEFVQESHDKNLVLVVFGDHQPAAIVSGRGANHVVPITVIAHDPKVLDRISSWGWQDGMRPGADAPLWQMSAFRDRFLAAYGPQPSDG